jgi:repressor LexA
MSQQTAKLTHRQQEILDFIHLSMRRNGYPPTRAEIGTHFGFRSPNAAEQHLRALARKMVIRIEKGTSRGIRLIEPAAPVHALANAGLHPATEGLPSLPLIGRVAAGSPVLASENIEDHYAIDPLLFRPRPDYLLRVIGMSMRDAGILDGDLLAVHRSPVASNGQIVVARLDDEVTVKRFERQDAMVRLLPENPDFKPIQINLEQQELVIEGLGVGVIRSIP